MERYEDPLDPLNGVEHQTGNLCIEECGRLAGTCWSPYWCQPCNAARMNRISATLEHEVARMEGRVTPESIPSNQR